MNKEKMSAKIFLSTQKKGGGGGGGYILRIQKVDKIWEGCSERLS